MSSLRRKWHLEKGFSSGIGAEAGWRSLFPRHPQENPDADGTRQRQSDQASTGVEKHYADASAAALGGGRRGAGRVYGPLLRRAGRVLGGPIPSYIALLTQSVYEYRTTHSVEE